MTKVKAAPKGQQLKLKISKELFAQWKRLFRENEDVKQLIELTGKSKPTITNALKYGHVSNAETVEIITNYFLYRDKSEKEQVEKLKNI